VHGRGLAVAGRRLGTRAAEELGELREAAEDVVVDALGILRQDRPAPIGGRDHALSRPMQEVGVDHVGDGPVDSVR